MMFHSLRKGTTQTIWGVQNLADDDSHARPDSSFLPQDRAQKNQQVPATHCTCGSGACTAGLSWIPWTKEEMLARWCDSGPQAAWNKRGTCNSWKQNCLVNKIHEQ